LVNKCIEKYIESCKSETKAEEHQQYKSVVDYVVDNSIQAKEYKMPLGVALDTQDCELFGRLYKIAEFNDFVEILLPHLLTLDLGFRAKILDIVGQNIPTQCNLIHDRSC